MSNIDHIHLYSIISNIYMYPETYFQILKYKKLFKVKISLI